MAKINKKEKIKSAKNPPPLKIKLKSGDDNSQFAENIINTVREPLIVLDQELKIVTASRSFYSFFKVNPEETIGKLLYDLGNHQWDIPKLRELLETILPEKTTFDNYEVEHDFSTIGKRIMLLNARQIKRALGKEKIILLAIEDITERRRVEESLSEKSRITEEYLNILLNHAHAPIIIWDPSLAIKRFNREFEKLSGYLWTEVQDKKIDMLFPEDQIDSTIELIKNNIGDEKSEVIEINILTKNKDIKTVLWNSANILDKEGKNIVSTIAQDITKRKLNEETLRQERDFSRTIVQTSPTFFVAIGSDGKTIMMNDLMLQTLGYTLNEVVGMDYLTNFVRVEDREKLSKIFKTLVDTSEPTVNENRILAKDGRQIIVEWHGKNILKPSGEFNYFFGIGTNITERKRAEEALRESEKLYQLIFEQARDSIMLLELPPEGIPIIRDANTATQTMLGFSHNELIGQPISMISAEEDFALLVTERSRRVQIAGSAIFAVRHRRKDGSVLYVESSVKEMTVSGKRLSLIIERDITERKRAEMALKTSEERFRTAAESLMDVVYVWDIKEKVDWYGDIDGIMGYPPGGFPRTIEGWAGTIHPEDKDRVMAAVEGHLKGMAPYLMEYRVERRDGEWRWWSARGTALRDDRGEPFKMIGSITDITEHKLAEEELRESEEKYKTITQSTVDVIFTLDKSGKLLFFNESVERVLGYKVEEVIGKSFTKFVQKKDLIKLFKQIKNVFQYKEMSNFVTQIYHKDGHLLDVEINGKLITQKGKYVAQGSIRDITERKRAEEELRKSEEKIRNIFETANEGICVTNRSEEIISVNKKFTELVGYSSDEIIGKNFKMFLMEEELAGYREKQKIRQTGENDIYERRLVRKDGSVIWTTIAASPIINEDGSFNGSFGMFTDITERKRMVEDLLKLSKAVEQSPASIIITDTKGNIEYINSKVTEIAGYQFAEVHGKNPRIFSTGEMPKSEYKNLWDTVSSGKEWRGEFHNKKKNGGLYWELALISPIINEKGEITHYLAVKEDITERKRSEEEITMLAHSLRSIKECVSITDLEDKILFVNESFLKTYGYNENELIGKHISIVRSLSNPLEFVKEILPATIRGEWQGELLNKRKDGSEFPVYLSTTIINDKEGKPLGLIGVATDITERKLAEKELIEAKEKAEQSDKLKSEFLAQMSHEIRTPLNAIVGNVEYLNDLFGKKMDPDARDCFDVIDLASKRIIRTVELILNTAELQTSGYKPKFIKIDLTEVLDILYQEHQLSAKQKGLDITYTCKEKGTKVIADEYSTIQIFANLINNAIKYTKKGIVEIRLGKNKTGNIIVEVKDSGIGMSKEFLPRIFEPFTQEEQGYNRSFEGNGLGLALVKNYCNINNVLIEVESEKNVGSTFRIIFNKEAAKV